MLTDYLGIAVAYIYVILLFSLIVTALAQATQAWLSLRAKNLQEGLRNVFYNLRKDKSVDESMTNSLNVLTAADCNPLALQDKAANESATTWIAPEEFEQLLVNTDLTDEQKVVANERFQKLDPWLSNKFTLQMRKVSIVWAALLAAIFQLDTFALISRISIDDEYRSALIAAAERRVKEQDAIEETSEPLELAAASALETLAEEKADYREVLETLSGVGDTREELLREADMLFSSLKGGDKLESRYVELIEERLEEQEEAAKEALARELEEVRALDFKVIEGWQSLSYWFTPSAFMGGLVTIIFLTFGAPFWFDMLRNVIALRDLFSPKK